MTPVVDPPIALAQSVTVPLNGGKAITLTATNVDGGDLTFSIKTGPKHGDLTGDAPDLVYTPHADFFGIDSFVFNVEDASSNESQATVSITVTPPVFTPGIVDVLADGANHSCAMAGGGVQCWGDNSFGQLGDGTTTQRNAPVAVADLTTGVQAIAAGNNHTCALVNGGVWCWGNNSHGQLGDGTTTSSDVPVQVPTLLHHVQSITAGGDHTCALVNNGVWCWGQGGLGQLGNEATEDSSVPVAVSRLDHGVQSISAGLNHTCAVSYGGSECWGDNSAGQLASTFVTSAAEPISSGFLDNGVSSISAGANHTCAVQNGSVICWGLNNHGQLGNNSTQNSTDTDQVILSSGVQSISASSAGNHTCAVTNGGVLCWGQNDSGQTGIPSHIERHVPTAVPNLSAGVQAIEAGGSHTCALIDGHVQCWGAGSSGQLGDGAATASTSAVQAIGMTYGIAEVAVGDLFGCEIVNGAIYCWGDDQAGQTGSYPAVRADGSPIGVTNITSGAEQVAEGGNTACALVNGGVWCWGNNQYGQCGDGTNVENDVPVSVLGLDSGVQAIAVGMYHACALKDGDVFCWGYAASGALGDGDLAGENNSGFKSTPVQVSGVGGVQTLAAGQWSTCALTGGNVVCWGLTYQSDPQSGFDETFATPTGIDGLVDGVVTAITAGYAITQCAILNGGMQCWGNNPDGELGVNSVIGSATPAAVNGLESDAGVQAIGIGGSQSCAVVDGAYECTGENEGTFANGSIHDTHLTMSPSLITGGVQQISMFYDTVCALIDGQVQCWGDDHSNALGVDVSYTDVFQYSYVPAPLQSWAQ